MIIQLLTHHTKSMLKLLINQLCDISRCNTQSNFWKSQMWWYGRGNSGGSWLSEEKKAKMWHGRGNSGGSRLPAFPRSSSRSLPLIVLKHS